MSRLNKMMGIAAAFFASSLATAFAERLAISSGDCEIAFDSQTGAVLDMSYKGNPLGLKFRPDLCVVKYYNKALQPLKTSQMKCAAVREGGKITLSFRRPDSDADALEVSVRGNGNGFDVNAEIKNVSDDVLQAEFFTMFDFAPEVAKGITVHSKTPRMTGVTLSEDFFRNVNDTSAPKVWSMGEYLGLEIRKHIYGDGNIPKFEKEVATKTVLGKHAKSWIGSGMLKKYSDAEAVWRINTNGKNDDIVLLSTSEGRPFLTGARLGGKGALFTFNGHFNDPYFTRDIAYIASDVALNARQYARSAKSQSSRIIVVDFKGVGDSKEWVRHFKKIFGGGIETVDTFGGVKAALKDPRTLFIANPLAEAMPCAKADAVEMTELIKAFVQRGGYWFDTHRSSFYYSIVKKPVYSRISSRVPAGIADFYHFDLSGGIFALYTVQPNVQSNNYENVGEALLPVSFSVFGDARGGHFERVSMAYVEKGGGYKYPTLRLNFGKSVQKSVDAFCADNKLSKTYDQKLDAQLADRFKNGVMFYVGARTVDDLNKAIAALPKNNVVHITSYLHGGFDKQYPVHLPPRESFATPEQFRKCIDDMRASGHLFMPYVNNTWWCDDPKSWFFEKYGRAPISLYKNKSEMREQYGKNVGWQVSMWHPDVRRACDMIVDEFTKDYPCDILFQDQTGARSFTIDFNPSAPSPNHYMDGLAAAAKRDSKRVPLSTEDGWWGIADAEVQFCGMTFGMFDSPNVPPWSWNQIWKAYPKSGVKIANLVGAFFHDKLSLSHHDLGSGLHMRKHVSMTLGIGYTMMMHGNVRTYTENAERMEFAKWLDVLQKNVVSKYIGKKMRRFSHKWRDVSKDIDDGIYRAKYGDIKVVANMSEFPLEEKNAAISAGGFQASGDGVYAGIVDSLGGIAGGEGCGYAVNTASKKVWIYHDSGGDAVFLCPDKIERLSFAGGGDVDFAQNGSIVKFRLPEDAAKRGFKAVYELQYK